MQLSTPNILKMSKVNLDALIPKEDFSSTRTETQLINDFPKLELAHLLPRDKSLSTRVHLLKKPDFQRATNEWDKKRIADLVESFMTGAFIPGIILWESNDNGNIYVIDGAHRISAMLSYINDDYGDKEISHNFYGFNTIPSAEIELAVETREYINKRLGKFEDIMKNGGHSADTVANNGFVVQWVRGNVEIAEKSFFKINRQGVALNPTEKILCKSRDFPTCIATRAIMKGGTGTQYWKNFKADNQSKIKDVAKELHEMLFIPPYKENPTSIILHHPLGGSPNTAMPMIFDIMKIIKDEDKDKKGIKELKDTVSGDETLDYLLRVRKVIWKILSNHTGSLGLFPSIYFYNATGKYIQSAFLGMVQLFLKNEANENFMPNFVKVRSRLEAFLIKYKVFLTQLNRTYGSKSKSYRHIQGYYSNLITYFLDGLTEEIILQLLKGRETVLNENESEVGRFRGDRFTKEVKNAHTIKEEILNTTTCYLCGGYIHLSSKSPDHKIDLKHGGKSDLTNIESTHWYCNSAKDKFISLGIFTVN